jgi:type VI secretion system protein VasJ
VVISVKVSSGYCCELLYSLPFLAHGKNKTNKNMKKPDDQMVASITAPVIGHALPQGGDIRYEPDFEKVESEIAKLTSVHKDHKTDWKLVQQLSYDLLTTRSKDLRVAGWFACALLKNHGTSQLPQVFSLLHGLLNQYWETCFPIKVRARLAALNWLLDRIDCNEDNFAEKLSSDALSELITALELCSNTLNEKFGDETPFLQPKLQLLRDIQRRQSIDKTTAAPAVVAPAVNMAPIIDTSAPSVSAITEEGDSLRIARYLQEQSRLLITHFLSKDIADPRAFLLTRSCAWLQVSAVPAADPQGLTKLKPLTANKLQEYQQRRSAKEFTALIPDLEISLSKAPFWLDGHHWCAEALEGIGQRQMANHIRDYLRSFLTKFPTLIDLRFDDGAAFANDETKAWLLAVAAEPSASTASFSQTESAEQPWAAALKIATENVQQNSALLKQEMRALQILANSATSGREKALWQLSLVKFCQQHQRHDLAHVILDDLHQFTMQFQLNIWEPALAKEILQLWLHSLEKVNSKQHQEKISEIKTNLYRMDISIAF